MNFNRLLLVIVAIFVVSNPALAEYEDWKHARSVHILTTPHGADLPASASESEFPLLVRLHREFFDFREAAEGGADIRFSTPAGKPLAYQIEEWDPVAGTASIWVRIPTITGNARQEIKIHWGKADAASESSGAAVFGKANGYLSVWHMNGPVKDEVGTLESKDVGTSQAVGIVGQARHFPGKQGVFCGDKIVGYPSGAEAHSTQAWFRAERPNVTVLGWGNEGGGRGSKVRMLLRSPPHIRIDSDFSDVKTDGLLPMNEWIHVAHTYSSGEGRIYINGKLEGAAKPMLAIKSPARLWLGGWYHNYDFVGDIDEVRISSVTRSAAWVRLEYENQKPLQTLAGHVVTPGSALSVTPAQATLGEVQSLRVSAEAGGAQRVYWTLERDGKETVVATGRFSYVFDAGRVTGDQTVKLRFHAVYGDDVKTREVPVTIKETVPDPQFTLTGPATWDGRATIEVVPQVTNASELKAARTGELEYTWDVAPIAVIKQVAPGKLILTRAQNSGKMTVTATAHNGGRRVSQSIHIAVTEPAGDAWVTRRPGKDEKPVDNQFYARDEKNEGTLHYNGTFDGAAEAIFLRVTADDKPYKYESLKLGDDKAYAFAVKLKPGLVKYKVEFGSETGERETVLHTVNNIVCGDAYLINGQSNAVASDWGKEEYNFTSPWIRTFGSVEGGAQAARLKLWGDAVARAPGGKLQVGCWAMELGRRLVESHKVPVCFINGAVGGTRIDQHQRDEADPQNVATIYGRLLWRVREAGLTHGVRAAFWHQGENDQGADGPTGGYGWETYRSYFIDMAAGWKRDYPNIQHYYVFQIWPKACAMGVNGSDNRLREVQRTLPAAFSKMSVMSTLGIDPPGGCHYPPAGYAEIARLICPLVERDHYGKKPDTSITPPNLKLAFFANEKNDEIVLEFDQPVKWDAALAGQFYLDGESGKVASGKAQGNQLTLTLSAESKARSLTYLDSKSWSQKTLLRGENGIAALTFCEVPLHAAGTARP